ncbi:serine hydrolase domain-containing protein [Aestuariibius sp. 2305UL40-4]|uniref:serine hydrolase domain-containing protein n=1 Tax=Aestuariibius violaceus TaxID=3234132 RepID=UPI00345E9392
MAAAGARVLRTTPARPAARGRAWRGRGAILSSLALCAAATVGVADPAARFQAVFEAETRGMGTVAVGAGFAFGDDAPTLLVRGNRFKGSAEAVPEDATWHVGSITKSVTATLAMRRVEGQALDLKSPLEAILPDLAEGMHPDWRRITMDELLGHRSGLPPNLPYRAFLSKETDARAERRRLLEAAWGKPIRGERGTFRYSNTGYVLAGHVLETLDGRHWEALVAEEIAGPLGLTSLGAGAPDGPGTPWGHRSFVGYLTAVDPGDARSDNPPWMGPAGTLHMSLNDLLEWGRVHVAACRGERPEFLSTAACLRMRDGQAENYGYGWVVQEMRTHGLTAVWHNGSNTMWYAVLTLIPERDLVITVTLNAPMGAQGDALMNALADALLGG